MDKSKLSDNEWENLLVNLKKIEGIRIGCEATCRQFVEAVLWILRAGAQWRYLPRSFGHWNSIFKRFARWSRFDVWEEILQSHAGQADLEHVCIDSTVIRAHACAAGAANSDQISEALGRSRGGFGCKIHALTDALGLLVRFILTREKGQPFQGNVGLCRSPVVATLIRQQSLVAAVSVFKHSHASY